MKPEVVGSTLADVRLFFQKQLPPTHCPALNLTRTQHLLALAVTRVQ